MTNTNQTATVVNVRVQEFADKYNLCVQKTANAIIDLANVVAEAKRTLSKELFTEFRNAIGADKSKDSYIKKLICIADASARFSQMIDKLPANYTTLYTLSSLKKDVFEQVVEDKVISPTMTALTLSKYLDKKTVKYIEIALSFKNVKESEMGEAFTALAKLSEKYGISYKAKCPQSEEKIKTLGDLKLQIQDGQITDVEDKELAIA